MLDNFINKRIYFLLITTLLLTNCKPKEVSYKIDANIASVAVSLTLTKNNITETIVLSEVSDYITKNEMMQKFDFNSTFANSNVMATLVFVSDRLSDESVLASTIELSGIEVELNYANSFKVAFNNMLAEKKFYDFTNVAKFKLKEQEQYVINPKNLQENKTFYNAGYIYLKPKNEENSVKYRVYIYGKEYYEKDGINRPKFEKKIN